MEHKNNDREEVLKRYRDMSLKELVKMRLYSSYVSGCAEQVIFEKVDRANVSIRPRKEGKG